jgi:hypothetical protein
MHVGEGPVQVIESAAIVRQAHRPARSRTCKYLHSAPHGSSRTTADTLPDFARCDPGSSKTAKSQKQVRERFSEVTAASDSSRGVMQNSWDNQRIMETSSLDLLYLERDPSTKQPSACVCVKAGIRQDYAGVKADKLITSACLSFIELDAEIRRLHAELDEIRSRAKKKFYRAQAVTAGA